MIHKVHGFESSIDNIDHSSLLGDGLSADGPEVLAIDPAMEHFLSEYLQGDWGWDPFSGSVSTLRSGSTFLEMVLIDDFNV